MRRAAGRVGASPFSPRRGPGFSLHRRPNARWLTSPSAAAPSMPSSSPSSSSSPASSSSQQPQQQAAAGTQPGAPLKPFKAIPRPKKSLPFLGNVEMLTDKMHEVVERYTNEAPLVRVKLGRVNLLLTADPDVAAYIFQSKNFVAKPVIESPIYFRLSNGISLGISGSNGAEWTRVRSVCHKTLLDPKIMHDFVLTMREISDFFVEKWKQLGEGAEVSLEPAFDAFTTDTIGHLAFGMDLNAMSGNKSELAQAVSDALKYFQELLFVSIPYYKYIQTPAVRKLNNAIGYIRDVGADLVRKHKKLLAEGQTVKGRANFVTQLLAKEDDEGKLLDTPDILGATFDVLIAGQDTTSRLMTWTIQALAKNPDVQERLYEEVAQHVKRSEDFTYDLMMGGSMPMLGNVLKESMRLFPPIVLYPRAAIEDDALDGYHIPAGTGVAVVPWALGRNSKLWKDPLAFNPDRFNEAYHPFAWVPFGAGRRGCVGLRLAMLEGKVMLASLIKNFKFEPSSKHPDPNMITQMTLRADGPVMVTLKHRS